MKKDQTVTETKKRRKLRIHEITPESDMRYRGPLHYQHFQVLGWLCIVCAALVMFLRLGVKLDKDLASHLGGVLTVMVWIGNFSLPFLLIANFSRILDDSKGYRGQLLKNVGAAAAIAALFYVFFYRYLVAAVAALIDQPDMALPLLQEALLPVIRNGFLAFNIFIDLLLCTLVMFFLNYRPTRVFRGKAVHFFRLFALLPIGYEVFCLVLKIGAARGTSVIPVWMYPLLPVKPVMTFVLFILLALFVKTRELRFRRHGKTHEEYKAFLHTNRNSWNFSVFLAVMLVIISIIDFVAVMGFSVYEAMPGYLQRMEQENAQVAGLATETDAIAIQGQAETPAAPEAEAQQPPADGEAATDEDTAAFERGVYTAYAVGFGGSMHLFLLAPLMLLYSYTRKPKHDRVGMLIPVAGIVLILIIFLEFGRYSLFHLPLPKISLDRLAEYAQLMMGAIE